MIKPTQQELLIAEDKERLVMIERMVLNMSSDKNPTLNPVILVTAKMAISHLLSNLNKTTKEINDIEGAYKTSK